MSPRALLVLALFTALPASAQQSRNELAASIGRLQGARLGSATAAGVSYNRFWTAKVSTRVGFFGSSGEASPDGGEKTTGTAHVSAEYHPMRARLFSPYAGLGVAIARLQIEYPFDGAVNDTSIVPILDVGVDVNLTPRFAIGADLRFMRYDADVGGEERVDPSVQNFTAMLSAKFRY